MTRRYVRAVWLAFREFAAVPLGWLSDLVAIPLGCLAALLFIAATWGLYALVMTHILSWLLGSS